MNFGSGGQIIALKSATALILDRYRALIIEKKCEISVNSLCVFKHNNLYFVIHLKYL